MNKLTKKWQIILYGCSGLGVNMLNIIMGTYLCSALLVGGFEKNVEHWTYLNKDLVVAALWGTLIVVAKVLDGLIDLPFSSFTDNLKTRWGRRRPAILIGYIPMLISYALFLVPINKEATVLNTIWFAALLCIFYGTYTLTMLTYYATFAEIVKDDKDRVLLSNVKSICDVVYFSMSFALVPVFVNMQMNIRTVALIFMPLALTMMIPMVMIKEKPTNTKDSLEKIKRVSFITSLKFSFKNTRFIYWLCLVFVMNMGLQLFLSGINEFFSTTGIDMTFVMASAFAPVPFTLMLYNKLVKKYGLKVGFQFVLLTFAIGMSLMMLCRVLPQNFILPFAIFCGIIVSFSIGAFFSVTYTIPSQMAAEYTEKTGISAATMYFAVQGLFEAVSAGIASGVILVFLKQSGLVSIITLAVAFFCMAAFVMAFFLPKSVALIGKENKEE